MSTVQNVLTCGEWAEESVGLDDFDRIVRRSEAFDVLSEVSGYFLQPRADTDVKGARIDRVLIPKRKAIDAGWLDGPIGVEGKKSNHKVGKIISQAIDYSRCVWESPNGFLFVLRWIFIWPLDNPKADLESIMAQNRIGYAHPSGCGLTFGCGGMNGIQIVADGSVRAKRLPMGRKVGSR